MRQHVDPQKSTEACAAMAETLVTVQGFSVESFEAFYENMGSLDPLAYEVFASFIEAQGTQKVYRGDYGLLVTESKLKAGLPGDSRFLLRALAKKTQNRNADDGEVCEVAVSISTKIRPFMVGDYQQWSLTLGGNKALPPGLPPMHDGATTQVNEVIDCVKPWINRNDTDLVRFRDMISYMGLALLSVAGAEVSSEIMQRTKDVPSAYSNSALYPTSGLIYFL